MDCRQSGLTRICFRSIKMHAHEMPNKRAALEYDRPHSMLSLQNYGKMRRSNDRVVTCGNETVQVTHV
jgi:hypothetical protein